MCIWYMHSARLCVPGTGHPSERGHDCPYISVLLHMRDGSDTQRYAFVPTDPWFRSCGPSWTVLDLHV